MFLSTMHHTSYVLHVSYIGKIVELKINCEISKNYKSFEKSNVCWNVFLNQNCLTNNITEKNENYANTNRMKTQS